ncbi:MAG: type II toxin-antitoxin system HicB family antitoxin [Candidatus Promineofilum sp.]|jgi:predicted RNase H-like HicB family nuclease|nr:type II toxin-antitoxin system HicB family antitoxin [Promineifilum sp.]MCW5863112.1 type II toxin-antitoxin system HicB family antitoxin [Anaerolineae bacterium]
MTTYVAVIERDMDTGYFVGYVPNFPGAHSQAETLDELYANLREVIELLLEDGEPTFETEFVGTQIHAGRDIAPSLLRQIAKDIDLTIEEFLAERK